jgi:uncharacterized protein (DUF1330 family)
MAGKAAVRKGEGSMPAYLIVVVEKVIDTASYDQYISQVASLVTGFGGRYLVRGGAVTPFTGDWHPQRVIVVEFPNLQHAQDCFASPEYQRIAPLRENSTVLRAIFSEGCEQAPG